MRTVCVDKLLHENHTELTIIWRINEMTKIHVEGNHSIQNYIHNISNVQYSTNRRH